MFGIQKASVIHYLHLGSTFLTRKTQAQDSVFVSKLFAKSADTAMMKGKKKSSVSVSRSLFISGVMLPQKKVLS